MTKPEFIKFEKIISINEQIEFKVENELIMNCIKTLFICMEETNNLHKVHTEYFQLRLKDSEKSPFAKDLKLEWATLKI